MVFFVVFISNIIKINHFVMYKNDNREKNKFHPRETYLDTNNFYWVIDAVYGSNLEGVNLVKRLHTNNQHICIDSLKPRSNKNERECKKRGCDCFYVSDY